MKFLTNVFPYILVGIHTYVTPPGTQSSNHDRSRNCMSHTTLLDAPCSVHLLTCSTQDCSHPCCCHCVDVLL